MLGDRIKLIREANKLTQVEFGKILNVTKTDCIQLGKQ